MKCSLLVRAGVLVTDSDSEPLRDAAVCIQEDRIIAIGPYDSLHQKYKPERECGGLANLVMPGLINAHDHGRGPSALQMGIPDDHLESWILDLMRLPPVDAFNNTAFSALEQLESGITTTTNSFYQGSDYAETFEKTLAAYRQTGIRAGLILSTLDRSIVVELLESVKPTLPVALQGFVAQLLTQQSATDQTQYFELLKQYQQQLSDGRQWVLGGPVSVHWCSQSLLEQIWEVTTELGLAIQTHLLESPYQKSSAQRRYGKSAVQFMDEAGLLTPNLSCAHCVHTTEDDIQRLSRAGVSVVHNAGSNLRLRNGVMPLPLMLEHGVNVALGLDSQTLNDDADMFQEMRLVSRLYPQGGPDSRQVFTMATINGARALGIDDQTGSLAVGKKADLLLIDTQKTKGSFLSTGTDIFDRIVLHTRPDAIAAVVVDGEVVLSNGRHCRMDKAAIGQKIAEQLELPLSKERLSFNRQISAIKPYLQMSLNEVDAYGTENSST